jgi:hypothetical protein
MCDRKMQDVNHTKIKKLLRNVWVSQRENHPVLVVCAVPPCPTRAFINSHPLTSHCVISVDITVDTVSVCKLQVSHDSC